MTDSANGKQKSVLKQYGPLFAVVLLLVVLYASGANQLISLDTLQNERGRLLELAATYTWVAPFAVFVIYTGLVAISFPGAAIMTIFSGFLFGAIGGGFVALAGATVGAVIIFEIAGSSLGSAMASKAGPYVQRARAGFQANELSYMFVLRLAPVFPFWVVNLVPALLGVKRRTYFIATATGMIPGTFVYAGIGAGAGAVLDAGKSLTLKGAMFEPVIIMPLLGLIMLSLIPVIVKAITRKISSKP